MASERSLREVRWESARAPGDLCVAEAIDGMVVDHPDGLHESVADGGTGELEAPALQVAAQGVGFGCAGREFPERAPGVGPGEAANVLPDVGVEAAELFLDGEECAGVGDGGGDLEAVADDAGVGEE